MSRVDQLILTRVEPPYSPKRESGYQIVYRSSGITSAEAEEVRRAVETFVVTRGLETPPRSQYFVLSTQKLVIAQSHAIETDNDIMDRTGRKGIFLAHCYVFEKQILSSFGNNPLVVLNSLPFASTTDALRNLITRFGKATGVAEPLEVALRFILQPSHSWSGDESNKLVRLASDAGKIKANGKIVLLVGTQEEILEALNMALYFAKDKLECTFNTNVDRMQIPPLGVYWAVGVSTMQTGPNFIQVNVSERRVVSTVDFAPTTDLYQIWFEEMTRLRRISERDRYAQVIQFLSRRFHLRQIWRADEVEALDGHEAAFESFKTVHRDLVLRRVRDAITQHIPTIPTLIDELLFFFDKHLAIIYLFYIAVPAEINPAYLIEITFRMVETFQVERGSLDVKDWEALCKFALNHKNEAKSVELAFWSAAFIGKDGNKLRLRALQLMHAGQYQRVLKKLGNPLEPTDFVGQPMSSQLLRMLFDQLTNMELSDDQLVSLIEVILSTGAGSVLKDLPQSILEHILRLSTEDLGRIERSLNNTFAPQAFTTVVEARRTQLPRPQNIVQKAISAVKNSYSAITALTSRIETNQLDHYELTAGLTISTPETFVPADQGIPITEQPPKRQPEVPLSEGEPFQTVAHPALDKEETPRPANRGVRATDEQSIKTNQEQDNSVPNDNHE